MYFDTLARPNSTSRIFCNETGILCNLIVGTCLSDNSSKYLILSLTIAFAASVFNVGNLLLCFGSTAGVFIDCSSFSAANCVSDSYLISDKMYHLYGKVRVLFWARLIFPRINGPNAKWLPFPILTRNFLSEE